MLMNIQKTIKLAPVCAIRGHETTPFSAPVPALPMKANEG
jgi:hypothetical protein